MFTGLVQSLALVVDVGQEPPGRRLLVREPGAAPLARVGESISLDGCCLTVAAVEGDLLAFDVGPETLRRTTLGDLAAGREVNLERSLAVGDRVGGHFVSGHVDGVGVVDGRYEEGAWATVWFRFPAELAGQMAPKGSVAVNGVSLTLVDVEAERFSVALVPHTLAATTLGRLAVGDRVNLETDLLAKYVAKQLNGRILVP